MTTHENTESIESLIRIVLESNKTTTEINKTIDQLRKLRNPLSDRWIYRTVVWVLGSIGLLTIVFGFILTNKNPTVILPQGLIAIGSAAIGALAGMLVPGAGQSVSNS